MSDVCATIEGAVTRFIDLHALWPQGSTVVVGVSGGPDSLCLLGTLLALKERAHESAPAQVVVAHLDHGIRGAEGLADAEYVAQFAADHRVRCVVKHADILAVAREQRMSVEDAARRIRYAFLREVAHDVAAARICVAHTRDDQAETVVLHWLRGSGLKGLRGMIPLSEDIARPLLDIPRAQTIAYCAERGWEPRVDATNDDTHYLRNRVRHELLPLLERCNPHLRLVLARNARLLDADERYLEAQTDAAWAASVIENSEERVALNSAVVREQHVALRHRLFRRATHRLAGQEFGPEAKHIAALDLLLMHAHHGKRVDLPGSLLARMEYGSLVFERRDTTRSSAMARTSQTRELSTRQEASWVLPVPGTIELPLLGCRIIAEVREPSAQRGQRAARDTSTASSTTAPICVDGVPLSETRVLLDGRVAGNTLLVRIWQPGDRFQPLGMPHEKKLQDYFTDAKIPPRLRGQLPLVFGSDHLLWLTGFRIDDRARLKMDTRRILALELVPLETRRPNE